MECTRTAPIQPCGAVKQSSSYLAQSQQRSVVGARPAGTGTVGVHDAGPLGLCMGVTDASFVSTTEVYPDSPRATDEICIQAQVAAIRGGLVHVLGRSL